MQIKIFNLKNQNAMKTKFQSITFLFAIIGIAFVFSLTSCKREYEAKQMSADAYNYIYAHTSGTISKANPVRIRFTRAAIDSTQIGQQADASVLYFLPKIKGEAKWEDPKTLLFQPTNHWSSGTKYVANVNLKKLFDDTPASANDVEFEFQTVELAFEVSLVGLQAVNNNSLEKQELKGELTTSDIVDNAAIEQIVTAQQENRDLNVRWTHGKANKHTFFVEDVRREQTQDGEVRIFWDGAPINLSTKGEDAFGIPALNNFKVTNLETVQGKDQHFVLHFSDPLLKSQNLDGLISIKNYKGDLRFTIDGNSLKVYPSGRLVGPQEVIVRQGLKNVNKLKMRDQSSWTMTLQDIKPDLRLVGKGVVMPNSDGLIFPFEAVSLNAVDVEIFKIFDNNILQFLQTNELEGSYDLERVGRIVMQQKVSLKELDPTARFYEWRRYALDLSQLIDADPNAIYQVRIGFRPKYSTYYCDKSSNDDSNRNVDGDYYEDDYYGEDYYEEEYRNTNFTDQTEYESIWGGYYGIEGYYNGYSWKHREDPCYPGYYNYNRFIRRNVIASDLGLIAKGGTEGSLFVAVSDLKTTDPISGTELNFYDYQNQLLKTVTTDGNGTAQVQLPRKPFVVVANRGLQKGYLKLGDGSSLSLSKFDVAGAKTQKGLKGYIYGERGVWRPGDSIYLNFVLEDKSNKLPANYPITFEFYDPRGQLQQKKTTSENIQGLYALQTSTNQDDPTGNWMAKVKAGGATFSKTIKVETVKPNRLKIKLDFGEGELVNQADGKVQGNLQVNWLHGAPAKNLNTKVEVQLRDYRTKFENFEDFVFDDPARRIGNIDPTTVFEAPVNDKGSALLAAKINNQTAPGKLKANFKVRSFEKGGDASVNTFTKTYSPYNTYAGVKVPRGRYGYSMINVGQPGTLEFALVDENGKPIKGQELSVGLYRTNWRWWWDRSYDNVSGYNAVNHTGSIDKTKIYTKSDGTAAWDISVKKYGRYMVRVCDEASGHCSGTYFYSGNPYSNGNASRENASILAFSSNKTKYNVGETIELNIPTGDAGRALISIENGSKVVETHWMDAKKGENKFRFYATAEMTPTVYANVTLVQPHAQVQNDLPIRMYGVIPISVEDPKTKLKPTIAMPDVLEPEQKVTVKVGEQNGQAMAYTIAMVDDGLLDLTNFKTPNPWSTFYAREALGVKTWDIYDQVLGAYGGELERVLSIGGDGEADSPKEGKKANRFKPVVRHLGPFYLEKGAEATHEITMPNYVGSVRTMVVASNNGAYGSVENTSPVRKPVMVLATLPRVIGPGETLSLPVNVFAMEDRIKNVQVTVEETSGMVNFLGSNQQSIAFERPDDKIANFEIKVGEAIGIAKFKITAKGGGEVATQEIELDVRNPNPYVTNVEKSIVENGQEWDIQMNPVGIKGTNEAILEVSNIPPIDMERRMKYLLRYPYGCLEQTTSKGFPLLFADRLIELDAEQKERVPKIIQATADRLKKFQRSNGAFAYWIGSRNTYINSWGNVYAGHFLLEAKKQGYAVSEFVLDKYLKYQRKIARSWDPELNNEGLYKNNSDLEQAYRLFVLALAQEPEYGAMNRMREMSKLRHTAKWRLAAAYAISGKKEVAKELINNLATSVEDYTEMSYTFGTSLRDHAMIVETLTILNEKEKAMDLVETISGQISGNRWWGTHTLAYTLMAIGKFIGDDSLSKEFNFAYQIDGGKVVNAGSSNPIMQIDIPIAGTESKRLKFTNMSNGMLFTRLIATGQPMIGDQTAKESHLQMLVEYTDMEGKAIDPESITQGTDFVASVTITNPGTKGKNYKEMALTQVFPSGWEIINSRMDNLSFKSVDSKTNYFTYQDIKDDRVDTFFDVYNGKSRTYNVQLNAAYIGDFYMATTSCEAMYDNTISARQPGKWIKVTKPEYF